MTMETYQLSTKHTKCNLLFLCTSYLSSLQLVLQQGEEGLLRKPLLSQVGLSEVPRERDQLVLAEGRYLNEVRKMLGDRAPSPVTVTHATFQLYRLPLGYPLPDCGHHISIVRP